MTLRFCWKPRERLQTHLRVTSINTRKLGRWVCHKLAVLVNKKSRKQWNKKIMLAVPFKEEQHDCVMCVCGGGGGRKESKSIKEMKRKGI